MYPGMNTNAKINVPTASPAVPNGYSSTPYPPSYANLPNFPSYPESTQDIAQMLANLSAYHPQRKSHITKDVVNLLKQQRTLEASVAPYTSNYGVTLSLLKISGTIPIYYKNNQYNIPIAVWISENYPREAPFVFVEPTKNMHITANHENVAPDGRVYLPYLNQWNEYESNLAGLAQVCTDFFSRSPPVRANSTNSSNDSTNLTSNSTVSPNFSTNYHANNPPPVYGANYYNNSNQNQQNLGVNLPPISVPMQNSWSNSSNYSRPVFTNPYDFNNNGVNEKENYLNLVTKKLQEELYKYLNEVKVDMDEQFRIEKELNKNEKRIEEVKQILNNDLDEVNLYIDNTSKNVELLENFVAKLREGRSPKPSKAKINEEAENLNSNDPENSDTKNVDLKIESDMDLDAIVIAGDKLSSQMFDCMSASCAIDDVLYYLDKALGEGNISLDEFLKFIRKLSREQFMKKALAMKILKKQQVIRLRR